MEQVQRFAPSPALSQFVASYEYRSVPIGGYLIRPVWARPHVTLQIFLPHNGEAYEYQSRRTWLLPRTLIVGAITHRISDLALRGNHRIFIVVFRPGTFVRLFGVPASELTDHGYAAFVVLGKRMAGMVEQLEGAGDVPAMIVTMEQFLLQQVSTAAPAEPVHVAASHLLRTHGAGRVAGLIRDSGMSVHEFIRQFVQQIGVAPKQYARIVRFDYAVRLKLGNPAMSWMDVSHAAGYFDQNHFIKEFKAMSGQLPSSSGPGLAGAPMQLPLSTAAVKPRDRHTFDAAGAPR